MEKQPHDLWDLIDSIDAENTRIGMLLDALALVTGSLNKELLVKNPAMYANPLYIVLEQLQISQKKIQDLADHGFDFAKAQRTAATATAVRTTAP